MREHEVGLPFKRTRPAKRLGQGHGSGKGTTAGRGQKGQKSRRGVRIRPGFEGGQLPLIKRLPHLRGFTNPFRIEYQPVGVGDLDRKFETGAEVTPEALFMAGLIRKKSMPVKVLGQGEITKSFVVKAHRFSASARQKIEAAKGAAQQIDASTTVTAATAAQ